MRLRSMRKKTKKLPEKIDILGHSIAVIMQDDLEHYNSAYGLSKFKERVILIESSLDYDQQVETLIHEIIEFANDFLELSLDHNKICALETTLFQALKSGGILNVE